jgi:methyl-accepting chemotaxis protein
MQQIDAVTQRTVSASGELAATAQELSAQAAGLKQLVDYFRGREQARALGGRATRALA